MVCYNLSSKRAINIAPPFGLVVTACIRKETIEEEVDKSLVCRPL